MDLHRLHDAVEAARGAEGLPEKAGPTKKLHESEDVGLQLIRSFAFECSASVLGLGKRCPHLGGVEGRVLWVAANLNHPTTSLFIWECGQYIGAIVVVAFVFEMFSRHARRFNMHSCSVAQAGELARLERHFKQVR